MTKEEDFRRMAQLATEAADAAAKGSAAGLSLLLAEMKALCAVMPGMPCGPAASCDCADREAKQRNVEAEVEASFDNMPV